MRIRLFSRFIIMTGIIHSSDIDIILAVNGEAVNTEPWNEPS